MTKTQIVTELEYLKNLNGFDGRSVIGTAVSVTNAGDGLSEGMKVEPVELHHGQTVYVVLECEVTKVAHEVAKGWEAADPEAPLTRTHTLKAGTATLIDQEQVEQAINEQKARIRRAREQATGTMSLPGTDDPWGEPAPDDNGSPLYDDEPDE